MWWFLTFDVWKNMLAWMHFDDEYSEDPWKNAIQSRNVPSKTEHATSSAFYNSPNKSPCSPSLHYSSLAVLSFFAHSRTHNARGHCVCADISWFSALPGAHWGVRREDDKEKETVRRREREQSHPPKTLKLAQSMNACFYLLPLNVCSPTPSLLCHLSLGLFVGFACRGEVPVMPDHNMTLQNIGLLFPTVFMSYGLSASLIQLGWWCRLNNSATGVGGLFLWLLACHF